MKKEELTITSGLNGNDFVEDKRTYIIENSGNRVCFRFGNSWNPNLFKKIVMFKLNRYFKTK